MSTNLRLHLRLSPKFAAFFCGLTVLVTTLTSYSLLHACPFCTAQGNTILQEIQSSSKACIVKATRSVELKESLASEDASTIPFAVIQILAGKDSPNDTLSLPVFESWNTSDIALVLGFEEGERIEYAAPIKLSPQANCYLEGVMLHHDDPAQRLRYVAKWLDETDGWVSDDVYREFAQANYSMLLEIKDEFDPQWLKAQISDAGTTAERRRLYWTLLGVCGDPTDAVWIKEFLTQHEAQRQSDIGLEAAAACYLCLAKQDGLSYLKSQYLDREDVAYVHVNAIVQAIRFHLSEVQHVDREPLVQTLREILKIADLADLVIPDLARFEDWNAIQPLMNLYQKQDCTVNVRVQTIRFLRMCPLEEAKQSLETCRMIDPAAFRRAQILAIAPKP